MAVVIWKDNLMNIAVSDVMVKMATGFTTAGNYVDLEPANTAFPGPCTQRDLWRPEG